MRGDCLEAAIEMVYKHKISVLPLVPGSKRPLHDWEQYQSRFATANEMAHNWPADCNIGIVTGSISGLCVIDCESYEDACWFAQVNGKTSMIASTPRGYHLYFRHPAQPVMNAIKVKDTAGTPRYDVRGDGGYVVAPPSKVVEGPDVKMAGAYGWKLGRELKNPDDIPKFNMEWRPESTQASIVHGRVRDGEAYISKITAVSGQGGHNETYRAVCKLRESGLSSEEAMAAIAQWNIKNATPPWSLHELLHKVQSVYGK